MCYNLIKTKKQMKNVLVKYYTTEYYNWVRQDKLYAIN